MASRIHKRFDKDASKVPCHWQLFENDDKLEIYGRDPVPGDMRI